MPHFFVQVHHIDLLSQRILITSPTDIKHIVKVLRMSQGDTLVIHDGVGYAYAAFIEEIQIDKVVCVYSSRQNLDTGGLPDITLAYGIIKNKNEDFILQKCTELGVRQFIPVYMQFSNNREVYSENRMERLNRIVVEACKQSEQSFIPSMIRPVKFDELLATLDSYQNRLVFMEREDSTAISIPLAKGKTLIIIGPEGGFSQEECDMLKHHDVLSCSLGNFILRSETAAVAACSIIVYQYKLLRI